MQLQTNWKIMWSSGQEFIKVYAKLLQNSLHIESWEKITKQKYIQSQPHLIMSTRQNLSILHHNIYCQLQAEHNKKIN